MEQKAMPQQQEFQQTEQAIEQPVQQQVKQTQPVVEKKPLTQRTGYKVAWFLIKLGLIGGFFYGAYWILNEMGFIDKVIEGFLLFKQI